MSGGFCNGTSVTDGFHSATNPIVANRLMSCMDGAGKRPMTEIEYEKGDRVPLIRWLMSIPGERLR